MNSLWRHIMVGVAIGVAAGLVDQPLWVICVFSFLTSYVVNDLVTKIFSWRQ